jgi:transketolase
MASYNKYVQIGEPTATASGMETAMIQAAQKNSRIIAVLEDMGFPGLRWFTQNIPNRVIECGIAEQSAAVMAAGLAAEGFIPIIHSFAFAALGRAFNQIRQSVLVDRFNVKILGREGAWGEPGISHNTIENLNAARVLPNLLIVNPADGVESGKALTAIIDYIGPVFMRLETSPPPLKIFTEDYPFNLGKAYMVKDGKDATIIATGYMLSESIRAVDILEKDGIDMRIINMSTIKPLDDEAIVKAAEETGAIITAENSNIVGGLGEAVAAVMAEKMPAVMVRVGIEDEFSQSGKTAGGKDDLKEHFGLTPEDIAKAVRDCIAKKERFQIKRK